MDPGMFLKRFLQEMWEFPGMVLLLEALLAALLPMLPQPGSQRINLSRAVSTLSPFQEGLIQMKAKDGRRDCNMPMPPTALS